MYSSYVCIYIYIYIERERDIDIYTILVFIYNQYVMRSMDLSFVKHMGHLPNVQGPKSGNSAGLRHLKKMLKKTLKL